MAEQGFFISDLLGVVTPGTELPGALFEVEVAAGPVAGAYVNKKLTIEQFVAYLAAGGPAPASITENTASFYHADSTLQGVYGPDPLSLKQALDAVAAYFLAALNKAQAGQQGQLRPAAPTNPQVDDTGDTFSVLPNPLFPALGDNEAFYPGSAGTVALTSTNAYLASGRLYLRVTTNAAPGTVGIRVAASGNRPASAFATNATAFTGTAATPPPTADTTPPAVAFTFPASGATLTAGTSVTLTVTASDNVAVQGVAFTNGSTGASLGAGAKNGTSYTLAFTVPSTAGALSLTATATDAAGNTATATVNVTVQAAAQSNSLAANSSTPS